MTLTPYRFAGWLTAIFLLAPATAALGHGGATGIVKERMDLMKVLKDASKGIGDMIKGEEPFDPVQVAEHARAIHDRSDEIPDQFPEGSLHDPSEALPAIWRDWPQFEDLTRRLQAQSARLIQVAEEAGERRPIARQFAKVGRTCKDCHEDFRQKKQD